MNKTKIEWVKNPDGTQGYTWNPITGCLNHTPEGLCLGGLFPCYAYRLAHGRLKERYLSNHNVAPKYAQDVLFRTYEVPTNIGAIDPFYPRFWPERIEELNDRHQGIYYTKYYKPKGIFVCDMSDLFGIGIPEQWTRCVLSYIQSCPRYRFHLLTKQPQNLPPFSPFPENCWVGVTVCNDAMMTIALTNLANVEAKVRFLSIEPHLGFITMKSHPIKGIIDWIIDGSQTKPTVYPKIEWVEEIVRAADRAGIPVFQKDNLRPLLGNNLQQELP